MSTNIAFTEEHKYGAFDQEYKNGVQDIEGF